MSEEFVNLGFAEPLYEGRSALLVTVDFDEDEHWVPLSAIADESKCQSMKSGAGDLVVERWWARREGLCND